MKRRTVVVSALLAAVLGLFATRHPLLGQEPPPAAAEPMPVGSIVGWHAFGQPTDAPPAGWLPCDGRAIDDPWFVARFGAGHHTPNLNGAVAPPSGRSSGQPVFLRGGTRSAPDGYGGSDEAAHTHAFAHEHSIAHAHAMPHTHQHPHQHRVDLRTTTDGGDGAGPRDGGAFGQGTRRHSHDVRGMTDAATDATTRGADPAQTAASDAPTTGRATPATAETSTVASVPRHFTVTWIIKVRP